MPFQKGNTEGRKKGKRSTKTKRMSAYEFGKKLQGSLDEVFHRLMHWMRDDDPMVSLAAAKIIIDRAIGKPKESVEFSGPAGGPIQLTFSSNVLVDDVKVIEINEPRRVSLPASSEAGNGHAEPR